MDKGDRVAQMVGVHFQNSPFHLISRLPFSRRGRTAGYHKAMKLVAPGPDINLGHPINPTGKDKEAQWGGCADCRRNESSEEEESTRGCMASVKDEPNLETLKVASESV